MQDAVRSLGMGGCVVSVASGVGFGVGGLTVPFTILGEFLPTAIRGKILLYIRKDIYMIRYCLYTQLRVCLCQKMWDSGVMKLLGGTVFEM